MKILEQVIGFGVGYVNERFSHTVYIMLAAMFLLFLVNSLEYFIIYVKVTGPALPIYKKNQLEWRSTDIPNDIKEKKNK